MVRGLGRGLINGSILSAVTFAGACTVTSTTLTPDGGNTSADGGDAGVGPDGAMDGPMVGAFAFVPSNLSLSGIDLSTVADVDLSTNCELDTDTGPTAGGSCLRGAVETIMTQSDGSKVHVFIVKSLKIEPAAHLSVNRPVAGLPLAIIALGDITVLGTIDAHAIGDQAFGGGFQSTQNGQKGRSAATGEPAALDLKVAQDAIQVAQRHMRNAHYYDQARLFARLVAGHSNPRPLSEQLFICTGGGPGIMEAANRGAQEMGAPTVGLNIVLPHEQSGNPYVSPSLNFKFHYFALRKMHFMMRAKALVAFPGGFGTLDELFEVITLVQTGKAKPVPIILFGSDYWKRLIDFDVLVEEGAISPDDLKLFEYVDDPQVAWDAIRKFYQL